MTERVFETILEANVQSVWDFHSSVEALKVLTPPDRRVELISDDTEVRDGALQILRVRQFGIPLVWKARISEVREPTTFTDTAEKSPFKFWRHKHEFVAQGHQTLLRDTVSYALPFGAIGTLAGRLFVDRDIERLFAYRHKVTKELFQPSLGE